MDNNGIVTLENPNSAAAEAYRSLRTNIQFSSPDDRVKTIVVTSTGPNDGKSTTVANLAVVTAQAGYKTLLMDCDLRKPKIHRMFTISNREGISDLLAGEKTFKDIVCKTEVEGLHILTAGTIPPNPSELLTSGRMKRLIADLSNEFDYIIIDTPPVLLVTDAQILSKYATGTLIVIASGETDRNAANRAKELLTKINAKIIGVVLNRVEPPDIYYSKYYKDYGIERKGGNKNNKIMKNRSFKASKNPGKGRNTTTRNTSRKSFFYEAAKRVMDIAGALFGLVLTAPIFLITAAAIKIDSRGPVFFVQKRCGKDGKVFKMFKFRSMVVDAEKKLGELKDKNEMTGPVFKIRNDPRITRVGRFIRKTSIDELPQFINVLIGNMSLVGPRPPIDREVTNYTRYQMRRLSVKPGLTCYWQVSGRNNIDFDEWVELDLKYIRERNIWIDIKLIFRTFLVLFRDRNGC